jgi:hypothetical protein
MSNARELSELAGSYGTGGFVGMKNRIINGAMMIDQRNAGASITPTTSGTWYGVDRWQASVTQSSKFTLQQSTDAPTGFKNSLKVTSSSAYSVTGNDYFALLQQIEGYNVADCGFGTASAKTVTLSFWVKSSLTGSFGGSLENYAQNRCYSFAYTVSAANTWEYKTVTVAGDTTGTWNTDNTGGLLVWFGLGASGTRVGTAGAWGTQSGSGLQPTGTVSVVGTSGATFYITGVQIEVGTVATSFDFRSMGTELALCQRYYEKSYNTDVAVGAGSSPGMSGGPAVLYAAGSLLYSNSVFFKVTKRATPSISAWSYTGVSGQWHYGIAGSSEGLSNVAFIDIGMTGFRAYQTSVPAGQNTSYGQWAASAEL